MRKLLLVLLVTAFVVALPQGAFAQFRKDTGNPNISGILNTSNGGILFGFLDPSKMQMHHSVSMSYGTLAGNGLALSTYMNTIDYRFSDNLFLRTNIGIMTSPFNSYGEDFYLNKPQFFGGAELQYKFSENSRLMLQFQSTPYGYYYGRPAFSTFSQDPFTQ